MVILDIGCGKKKQEPGAIGLDRHPESSADKIYLCHFIEHQPNILRVMAEVRRIAKAEAEVVIVTPHYSSPGSYTDPTHVFHLGFHSFEYFEQSNFSDFVYDSGGFRILERRFTFGGNLLLDNLGRLLA